MPILSRFSITIPFANAIALSSYSVTDMATGVTAVVNSLNAQFRYDLTSTATPDGVNVIDAAGSVGRWLRIGGEAFKALQDMQEPTGFPNSDDALVTIAEGTRTVTLTPAAASYFFYSHAVIFTKTAPESIVFTDVEGAHAIYYDTNGVLQEAVNPSVVNLENIIRLEAYVANIYWDATNKKAIYWTKQNELHGLQMDGATHSNKHFTQGPQYLFGAGLNTLSVDDVVPTDASAQFGIDFGNGLDEDRAFTTAAALPTVGTPIYYLQGAGSVLRREYNAGFSILTGGTGLPVFNEFTGGVYQNTEVSSGNYLWIFTFMSNNSPEGYLTFLGSAQYAQIQAARDAFTDDLSVVLSRVEGIVENTVISGVLFEGKSSFTNAVKARIVSTNNGDYEDLRGQNIISSIGASQHDSLGGLSASFSHPQYVRANALTSATSVIGGGIRFVDALGTTEPISGQVAFGNIANTHINFGFDGITGASGFNRQHCTISGGLLGVASGSLSTVGGGNRSEATGQYSTVPGGTYCVASGFASFATNYYTTASADYTAAFGDGTIASADGAFACGDTSTASGDSSFVAGYSCLSSGSRSFSGGDTCAAGGNRSFCFGDNNTISSFSSDSAILGGLFNEIDTANGTHSFIAGGQENFINIGDCFIGGGYQNKINGTLPSELGNVICGGTQNVINNASNAIILGGLNNTTAAGLSCVGGTLMALTSAATNTFVWGHGIGTPAAITQSDAFLVFPYGNGVAGIGTTNASSILDVVSTSTGFKPPSMTTAQRLAYAFPGAERSLVYDNEIFAHFVGNNSAWLQLGSGGGSDAVASYGEMGWIENTDSVAANPNPVKVAGTSIAGELNEFVHTNGRLTYVGSDTKTFRVSLSYSWKLTSGAQDAAFGYVFKNGTIISKSGIRASIETVATNRMPTVQSINILTSLSTNDYVEMYVKNEDDSDPVAIEDLQFVVTSVAATTAPVAGTTKAGISKNSAQSFDNITPTALTGWDATDYSNGITVSLSTGELTVVTAGLYSVSASLFFAAGGSVGQRVAYFKKTASAVEYGKSEVSTNAAISLSISSVMQLAANDIIRLTGAQISGGILNASGAATYERCELQMVRVGD